MIAAVILSLLCCELMFDWLYTASFILSGCYSDRVITCLSDLNILNLTKDIFSLPIMTSFILKYTNKVPLENSYQLPYNCLTHVLLLVMNESSRHLSFAVQKFSTERVIKF